MRNLQIFSLTAIAVTALTTATIGQLSAGEPGVVRISDRASQGTSYRTQTIQTSARHNSYNHSATTFNGQCGPGGCSSCGNGCGECEDRDGGCCGKLCSHFGCKAPCHGWGRPIKRPINRLPVSYQRYWPNAWYGQAGAGYTGVNVNYYPAVYMPTDTTQLGYYYQQVPFWRPIPDMVPPVPWPSQWHLREGQNPYGSNGFGANGNCGANATGVDSDPQPIPEPADSPQDPGQEPPPVPQDTSETALNLIP